MIRPLTDKELTHIKEQCHKGFVTCFESRCPFLDPDCLLYERDGLHPHQKEWTGRNLFVGDDGQLYIKTGVKVNAKFPTKKECEEEQKARDRNFVENFP